MELSERWLQTFEKEGFVSVYEWQDAPDTLYKEHINQGKVSIFVTDGTLTLTFADVSQEVRAGERFDITPGKSYSATVGPHGWIGIIGQEIESDSFPQK